MHLLGRLQGRGTLEVGGKAVGEIDYKISVWQEGTGWKQADGSATGSDGGLEQAFAAGKAQLNLQQGGSVSIIVTRIGGGDAAEFRVSGPVPGF